MTNKEQTLSDKEQRYHMFLKEDVKGFIQKLKEHMYHNGDTKGIRLINKLAGEELTGEKK